MKLSAVDVALMGVFAALQALLSVLPFTITIGVSGQITLGVIGGPLIGILLGPIIGGFSVLIGSLIGVFVNPAGAFFGVFSVIPPFFGAFAAGCVKIKRAYIAGAVILASLLVFYAHPYGREAYIFPWLHIVAMIIAFSPIAMIAGSTFRASQTVKPVLGIIVASFIGIMADHITGSAMGIWYFSPFLTPEIWYGIMLVYPVERMVALALTCLVAIPVYYSLRTAGLIDSSKQRPSQPLDS